MNVFVQCGLRGRLEYAYLAEDNFLFEAYQCLYRGVKWYTPIELLAVHKPYQVIGVCMDPTIQEAAERHRENPRIHFIHSMLWHEDVETFEHNYYTAIDEYEHDANAQGERSICPAVTLNTLFRQIREIPGLAQANIKGLHMNIEKSEKNALMGTDWDTFDAPDVMRISMHGGEIKEICTSILEAQGYICEPHPYDFEEYTTFIKKESYLSKVRDLPEYHAGLLTGLELVSEQNTANKLRFRIEDRDTDAGLVSEQNTAKVFTKQHLDFWQENGYVVVPEAVPLENCRAAAAALWEFSQMSPDDPESWRTAMKTDRVLHKEILYIDMCHHQTLWNNRQHPRVHQAYAEIWGTEKLWVELQGGGISPPETPGFYEYPPLRLHWDIDLFKDLLTFNVGGLLYLTDTAENQGAWTCIPRFHHDIKAFIKDIPDNETLKEVMKTYRDQSVPVPGKAGDLILWDLRIPHAPGINTADVARVVQYMPIRPANEGNIERRQQRIDAWKKRLIRGKGDNFVAGIETSLMKTPAQLTELGEKLLGSRSWNA